MAYQYTNRRGDVYFVQAKKRGGKIAYSAARKPSGRLIDHLPDGYEIYEKPDTAQVFVRKIKESRILPMERRLVEASVHALGKPDHFIVEVEDQCVIVHMTDEDHDATLMLMRRVTPMTEETARSARQYMIRNGRYHKMLRFTLTEEKSRKFSAERWRFLGSMDGWHHLTGDKTLAELAEAYIPHLCRESFFELM
jgi:hypothetical protein